MPRPASTAFTCKDTHCLARFSFTGGQRTSYSRGSTHLLFQAHQCPGSSATFSNPGKKNCGRFGLALFFWGFMFGFKLGAVQRALTQPLSRPCQARASPFGAGVESLVLPSPWRAVAKSGPTQSSCGRPDAGWSCLQSRLAGGVWPAPGHLKHQLGCAPVLSALLLPGGRPADPCSHDSLCFVPSQAGCRAGALQCRGWHPASPRHLAG